MNLTRENIMPTVYDTQVVFLMTKSGVRNFLEKRMNCMVLLTGGQGTFPVRRPVMR